MPNTARNGDDQHAVNLNEMAQRSATKDDVILRIQEGMRVEQLQLEAQRGRKRSQAVALIICLLLISIGLIAIYSYVGERFKNQAKVPNDNPTLAFHATVSSKTIEVAVYYVLTKASLDTNEGPLDLYTYDFYSNRFLKNKEILTDPNLMKDIFAGFRTNDELRQRIEKSWVLIFAGASMEGSESYNLALSCERVRAVARMMVKDAGISSGGYWAIRAGEYKGTNGEGISRNDQEQETFLSHLTPQQKEDQLAPERRLIVAIITPHYRVSTGSEDGKMTLLANEFYRNKLLPDGYQYTLDQSRAKPMLIDLGELDNPALTCMPKQLKTLASPEGQTDVQ